MNSTIEISTFYRNKVSVRLMRCGVWTQQVGYTDRLSIKTFPPSASAYNHIVKSYLLLLLLLLAYLIIISIMVQSLQTASHAFCSVFNMTIVTLLP